MPVDLDEMFDALRVDADALPLGPPQRARRLGRRLRLIRVTVTIAATCALIVGAAAVVTPLARQPARWGADPSGPAPRLTFDAHPTGMNAIAYSPDGLLLATAGHDGTVGLWNAQTGQVAATLTSSATRSVVIQVAFSPDGKTVAASDAAGIIRLWDPGTLSSSVRCRRIGPARSPTSRSARTAGGWRRPGPARPSYGTSSPAICGRPSSETEDGITSVAFSPDGRTLAGSGTDGAVRLWDLPS